MKSIRPLMLGITVAAALGLEAAMAVDAEPRSVTLVQDGAPRCTIVLAAKPSAMSLFAAAELQWHIQQITGATIPVKRDMAGDGTNGGEIKDLPIYIGESPKVCELGLKNSAFADREFIVTLRPEGLILTGRSDDWELLPEAQPLALALTPPNMGYNRGSLFAVYEFLENHLGVRWYAPGNENICWPKKTQTLTVPVPEVRRIPAIRDRSVSYNNTGGINANAWGTQPPAPADHALFLIRNKVTGSELMSHSFEGWPERFDRPSSEFFEASHPEYFSTDQKEAQLCFTHTGTLAQAIADARRWADGKGTTHRANVGQDWYGLEPRDTHVRCQCDTCKPLLGKQGGFNSDEASVIVWGFADKVARALQETHPGKSVGLLAYGNHAGCPVDMDLATNIYVGMAVFPRGTPDLNNDDWKKFFTWSKKLPGRLQSVWIYPCFPREIAGTEGYTAFPKVEARGLNAQMRIFAEHKVRNFMICGNYDTVLDFWCSMKWQDNPQVDVEATITEFFQRYYGAAAAPLKKFYVGIEAASEGKDFAGEAGSWDIMGTDERMAEWAALIAEATALAVTEPEKSRVANIREQLWAEMLKGKRIWTHKSKYAADAAAFQKLPPLETNAVKLAKAPEGGDAINVDWTQITPVKIFRNMVGFPSEQRTADFYIAHDGVNVYVRLTDHVDTTRLNDSGNAWWGDRWELFFSRQSNRQAGKTLIERDKGEWGPYRQIGARPSAKAMDMWTSEKPDYDFWPKQDLKYHTVKSPTEWTFHFTIPMAIFSAAGPVKPGDMIYFNAIGPSEASGEVLALSPNLIAGAYHNVPRLAGFLLEK